MATYSLLPHHEYLRLGGLNTACRHRCIPVPISVRRREWGDSRSGSTAVSGHAMVESVPPPPSWTPEFPSCSNRTEPGRIRVTKLYVIHTLHPKSQCVCVKTSRRTLAIEYHCVSQASNIVMSMASGNHHQNCLESPFLCQIPQCRSGGIHQSL